MFFLILDYFFPYKKFQKIEYLKQLSVLKQKNVFKFVSLDSELT